MALWILSGTNRVSWYQKKHSPTHTYCGHQLSLICFIHIIWSMASSLFNLRAYLFPQSLSKFSLGYLLAWHSPLHTPYISSPNHCLIFAAYAHTIATCFAIIPRLCHLVLVSLSTLYLELYLVASHHTSITITKGKEWFLCNKSYTSQMSQPTTPKHCWRSLKNEFTSKERQQKYSMLNATYIKQHSNLRRQLVVRKYSSIFLSIVCLCFRNVSSLMSFKKNLQQIYISPLTIHKTKHFSTVSIQATLHIPFKNIIYTFIFPTVNYYGSIMFIYFVMWWTAS